MMPKPFVVLWGFLPICLLTGPSLPASDETAPQAESIRLAIEDLGERFPDAYRDGSEYLARLAEIEAMPACRERTAALTSLRRDALLANPLLDFERILLVRRKKNVTKSKLIYYKRMAQDLGLPLNFNGNSDLPRTGYDNQIVVMEGFRHKPVLREIHRPQRDVLVTDLELHFDGKRLLFSSLDETEHWHIYEIGVDGSGLRRVTPEELNTLDVHSYDACYLPDERIVFASTMTGQSVPCTGGKHLIANLCSMNPDGTGIRRLCFDQDQNWNPTVTEQGTVLYTRWQYTEYSPTTTRLCTRAPGGTPRRSMHWASPRLGTSMPFSVAWRLPKTDRPISTFRPIRRSAFSRSTPRARRCS
jgi:hypothetical protein